jgi:vancomycin resistance protein YoaR
MAITTTVIIPSKIAENAQTTQYTSPAGVTTIIDKFTATNYGASTATISINLVTASDTAGNQNLTVKTKSLTAGETYTFPEIVGHMIAANGFISTIASAASTINIRSSGRQVA